jgi:protein-disulfide isomerase
MKKSSTLRNIILTCLGIVLVVGALVAYGEYQDKQASISPLTNNVEADDHITGNRDAAVTVIEYGDFQCPACATYAPLMERLYTEYGDRVRFVFRHYPLISLHPMADEGAMAAEAASMQGKFFEFSKILFDRQDGWSKTTNPLDSFVGYAAELGLNEEQFKNDYKGSAAKQSIRADQASGNAAGVSGTPTFFVNGKKIESPRGYEAFKKILDDELAATAAPAPAASGTFPEGTPSTGSPAEATE